MNWFGWLKPQRIGPDLLAYGRVCEECGLFVRREVQDHDCDW